MNLFSINILLASSFSLLRFSQKSLLVSTSYVLLIHTVCSITAGRTRELIMWDFASLPLLHWLKSPSPIYSKVSVKVPLTKKKKAIRLGVCKNRSLPIGYFLNDLSWADSHTCAHTVSQTQINKHTPTRTCISG